MQEFENNDFIFLGQSTGQDGSIFWLCFNFDGKTFTYGR